MARAQPVETLEPPTGRRNVRPRAPRRGRGVVRYVALVDATEALLQENSTDDVGLYQIAERASVPPASVYHFFPTKEAAFLAVAQRYLEGFGQLGRKPIPASALDNWQTLMAWDHREAVAYYNAHPPALKLFLGGYGGVETRQADREYNEKAAKTLYNRFNRFFHMPFLRDADTKFHITLEILDAVWRISYLRSGVITEPFYEEALAACTAYCRLFLPERTELREEYRDAVGRGESILPSPEPPSDAL